MWRKSVTAIKFTDNATLQQVTAKFFDFLLQKAEIRTKHEFSSK